jgi:hypothetical protein
MVAAAIIVTVLILLGTVVVAGGLRRLVRDESAVEGRLRAPDAHIVSYAVPNGVDPAGFRGALAQGGFAVIERTSGTRESLVVECGEADRARLRRVLEGARETAYDGSGPGSAPVVFEDER